MHLHYCYSKNKVARSQVTKTGLCKKLPLLSVEQGTSLAFLFTMACAAPSQQATSSHLFILKNLVKIVVEYERCDPVVTYTFASAPLPKNIFLRRWMRVNRVTLMLSVSVVATETLSHCQETEPTNDTSHAAHAESKLSILQTFRAAALQHRDPMMKPNYCWMWVPILLRSAGCECPFY